MSYFWQISNDDSIKIINNIIDYFNKYNYDGTMCNHNNG